jgi:hypothetical protein
VRLNDGEDPRKEGSKTAETGSGVDSEMAPLTGRLVEGITAIKNSAIACRQWSPMVRR